MERTIKLSSPQELALVEEFYDIRKKYHEHHQFLKERFDRESVEAREVFTRRTRNVSQRIFKILGEDLEILDDPTRSIHLLNRFFEHGVCFLCIGEPKPPDEEEPEVVYDAVDHSDEFRLNKETRP